MISFESKLLDEAIRIMSSAEMFFLEEIKTSNWNSIEVVNALETLGYALKFAENVSSEIPVCSRCGGVFCQELEADTLQCLDCDFTWVCKTAGDDEIIRLGSAILYLDIDETIRSMRTVLAMLQNRKEPNLKKSVNYLAQSIEWAVQHQVQQGKTYLRHKAQFFKGNDMIQSISR